MILSLGDTLCDDPSVVGSKAANLSLLIKSHRIPPGFVITADAFHIAAGYGLWKGSEFDNVHGMPRRVYDQFVAAYNRLRLNSLSNEFCVAVRSSALEEDGISASFAGQHYTYLNVVKELDVVDAIVSCWGSVDNTSALEYRRKHGLNVDSTGIAVIIQEMVYPDASAVVFTTNPVTGNKEEILINATLGLCESIVNGIVVPDTYVVDKNDKKIIASDVAEKNIMRMPVQGGSQDVDVPEHLQRQPSITNEQVNEIANIATELEIKMGWPVDIECSYFHGNLYLLQCRPITGLR